MRFVTIGYGDRAGYDRTDRTVLDAAHAHDEVLRSRGVLMGIAGQHTRVAFAVSPAAARAELGEWCLEALATIVRRNGFHEVSFDAHFDEGILSAQASPARAALEACCDVAIRPNEDSKTCMGIQVADVVAHATGQMIREAAPWTVCLRPSSPGTLATRSA